MEIASRSQPAGEIWEPVGLRLLLWGIPADSRTIGESTKETGGDFSPMCGSAHTPNHRISSMKIGCAVGFEKGVVDSNGRLDMNTRTSFPGRLVQVAAFVPEMGSRVKRACLGLPAGLVFSAFLLAPVPALAQVAPDLGSTSTFGIVSATWDDETAGTAITGDVCYTTQPASLASITISGAVEVPCAGLKGTDQNSALADLNGQSCTPLGAAVDLNTVSIGGGPPGVFPPGCYSSTGAMNITTGTTVALNGAGVYIFRPDGAFTQGANSNVVAAGGACENDVFWTPTDATTIGANANIVGNIFRGTADGLSITFGDSSSLVGRALAYGSTVTTANTLISVPTCQPFETPIPAEGEVALGKAFGPTPVPAGGISTLTVTLSNNNPGVATLLSPLTDTLPDGVVIAPTPNAITTCGVGTPTAVAGSSTVSLPAGTTIPGGEPGTCVLVVDVTSEETGTYINTLEATALETDQGSNADPASATLDVITVIGIPTLSQWAMILLTLLLAAMGFAAMRRRAV